MAAQILAQIHKAFETRTCEFLTFSGLSPTVSAEILDDLLSQKDTRALRLRIHFIAPDGYLRIVMASRLHETAVGWMRAEYGLWIFDRLLTPFAHLSLDDSLSEYKTFVGPFIDSRKTPDLCYSPRINGVKTEFPTIVLESGWSELEAQLERNSQLWLEGSGGAVRVVLLFKLSQPNIHNQIKATLHVSRIVDDEIVMDTYKIFPPPPEPIEDPYIASGELFRGRCPYDTNPQTLYPLSLARLRYIAGQEIRQQGHLPMVNLADLD